MLLLLGGAECREDDAVVDEGSFYLDHEDSGESNKDEIIDDKLVISENLKRSQEPSPEWCCESEARFAQDIKAEDEEVFVVIQEEQGLISLETDDVAVVEKRLECECDPVAVEIKKCESAVQATEPEVVKREPERRTDLKKWGEPVRATEVKAVQPVEHRPRSSIAQRIKLWEAQVSGSLKAAGVENKADHDISVKKFSSESESTKDAKKRAVPPEAHHPCVGGTRDGGQLKAQADTTYEKQSEEEQEEEHGGEFKDVKECVVLSETGTFTEICSRNSSQAEENASASASLTEEVPEDAQPEVEHGRGCVAQAEQGCQAAQPEQEDVPETEEEHKDVRESPITRNDERREVGSPKPPTSIAGRVHSRTSSENLVSEEGSPSSQREKEWKRTLACKLYEERMQIKLCRDRAVIEASDNMDMLWEAYEVGGGGDGVNVRRSKRVDELVEETEEEEQDDDHESSVRQLCCLQALKFSTKKMGFGGGGKPSLAKISKVLKRMAVLSRVGSRHSQKA